MLIDITDMTDAEIDTILGMDEDADAGRDWDAEADAAAEEALMDSMHWDSF